LVEDDPSKQPQRTGDPKAGELDAGKFGAVGSSPAGGGGEPPSLTSRVARGTAWIVASRMIMRVFGFVNMIVVARLLAPEDFGLVAIGLTTMQLLQGFSDIGVSQAVVRFRDAGRDDLGTLFTLSALRGLAIALLLLLAAPLAASFFNDSRVFWVFAGVAIYPLVTGLINPRFFEFERELDFSKEFISSAVNKLAGVVVSITIAVIFRSYWAIIFGLVTGAIVQLAISYLMRPYRPRITFASFRKVIEFSGWLTGVSFMAALNNKLDALVLARAVGTDGVGNYYVGHQLAEMPTSELAFPLARAIYPGLSELQENPARMRDAFLRGVEALGAIALPAALGFAFIARDLVTLLLGSKWDAAIPVVEILTPVIGVQTLLLATQFYAMALGMTRLVFFRELAFFIIRTPIFIWASIEHGLTGAIWAAAGCGVIHVILNLALYSRASGKPFWQPLWGARRSLLAAGVMSLYFAFVRPGIGALENAPLIMRLLADIAAGGAVYFSAHYLAWRIDGSPDGAERSFARLAKGARARWLAS